MHSFAALALSVQLLAAMTFAVAGQAPLIESISFKAPFSESGEPPTHWTLHGSARVTPTGIVMLANPYQASVLVSRDEIRVPSWRTEVSFTVLNPDPLATVGSEGLAFWFTSEPQRPGPLYGAATEFHGVMVVVDLVDDNKDGVHSEILARVHDRSKMVNPTVPDMHEIAQVRCAVDVRVANSWQAVTLSLDYSRFNRSVALGFTDSRGMHRTCGLLVGELPEYGYLAVSGVSASATDLVTVNSLGFSLRVSQPDSSSAAATSATAAVKSGDSSPSGALTELRASVSSLARMITTLESTVASEFKALAQAHREMQPNQLHDASDELARAVAARVDAALAARGCAGGGTGAGGQSWLAIGAWFGAQAAMIYIAVLVGRLGRGGGGGYKLP